MEIEPGLGRQFGHPGALMRGPDLGIRPVGDHRGKSRLGQPAHIHGLDLGRDGKVWGELA